MKKIARIEVIDTGSNPDIDSDFRTDIRDEVVRHTQELYGERNVASIATFQTLAAKGAFKVMCTIYQIPFAQANKISSLIPNDKDCTLSDLMDPSSPRYSEGADFRAATSGGNWPQVIEGARNLESRIRGVGVHPCGVVISSQNLYNTVPLMTNKKDGGITTQWTYPELESMGLIKFDFLFLDAVDNVQETVKYILRAGKKAPNMVEIAKGPKDDRKTYELFHSGNLTGVFQFGSDLAMDYARRMKPDRFEDLYAATALLRPGPMGMLSHVRYAERKQGRETVKPIHPDFTGGPLDEILEPTYGLCVPAGTKVLDSSTGIYVPIEALRAGVSTTASYSPAGRAEEKPVTAVVRTGIKPLVRLTMNGRRELVVSATHPVLTSEGYKPAGEIKPGDRVAVSAAELPVSAESTMSADEAYFLGAMLGDGSITGTNQPYFTNSEDEILSEMERIARGLFDGIFTSRVPRVRDGEPYTTMLTFHSGNPETMRSGVKAPASPVSAWFADLGLGGKVLMYDKYIPDTAFTQGNDILAHVVAGLWDTDGMVTSNGVCFTTTSVRLHETMQLALTRLGVDFGVAADPYHNNTRPDRTAYRIYPAHLDFSEKIRPLLRLSRKRNEMSCRRTQVSHNGLAIHERRIFADFFSWLKDRGYSRRSLGKYAAFSAARTFFGANASSIRDLADTLAANGILSAETLGFMAHRFRTVASVENAGKAECYDITVADNHNFITNGFVVHNCVYQEQILQISNRVAGMSLKQGDELRSAMGKKKKDKMEALKPIFMEGGMKNGYSKDAMTTLWDTIAVFAEYGFNAAHSVAYAMTAYQTAYLKAHYPAEFMAASIAQKAGNKEKNLELLQEARNMGLKVGPPDINLSDIRVAPDFSGKSEYDILYGLGGILMMSDTTARIIIDEREKNGPFTSVQDAITRLYRAGMTSRRAFENLALAGAFDSFGVSRRSVVENVAGMMQGAKTEKANGSSLFDMLGESDSAESAAVDLTTTGEYPYVEKLQKEAEMIGLYLTGHPLSNMGTGISQAGSVMSIKALMASQSPVTATIVASCTEIAEKTQKKTGAKSVRVTLDDGTAYIEANLRREIVKGIGKRSAQLTIERLWKSGETSVPAEVEAMALSPEFKATEPVALNNVYLVEVTFRPAHDDAPYGARVNSIRPLSLSHDGKLPLRMRIKTKTELLGTSKLAQGAEKFLKGLSAKFPGEYPVHIAYVTPETSVTPVDEDYYHRFLASNIGSADAVRSSAPARSRKDSLFGGASSGTGNGKKKDDRAKRELPDIHEVMKTAGEMRQLTEEELADTAAYEDTGFRAGKTGPLEEMLSSKFGAERVDFGTYNRILND